ncbi:hypothetical protein GCM10010300_68800 [Streptomyces olivaceoviridis]|nr:hypothetical protein GCM10010300_68800 [Streptomyces olivaceoviridis]
MGTGIPRAEPGAGAFDDPAMGVAARGVSGSVGCLARWFHGQPDVTAGGTIRSADSLDT